ncbi:MAG: isocitrate lyase/PEP mutase family protein [Candidatus Rokubacteria bacterium]|nr:isocitrate lyase/PEP mutase family protein [Candidatus Rokubacteria bacterium]
MERMGKRFRQLLREQPYVFTAGVYSALDAQIAERAGLKSVYMSGYSVAMLNGWPDMGFLTMTEMTTTASAIASAAGIPVIADADDGYGNALSTLRTVREYVKTGVAGIHIEDQRFPKRCGHIAGKTLVPREEAVGKFRAAVDERTRLDPEFVLIARTDAFGAVGGSLEEAIWRARAYADAGVDLVWCEFSNPDRDPVIAFAQAMRKTHPDLPLAFNYSSSFRWHEDPRPFRFRELGELGYRFIFITLFGAHAAMYGVWNAMTDLVRNEEEAQWALERTKKGHPTESHHEMARVPHFKELETRYVPDAAARYRASDGFGEDRAPTAAGICSPPGPCSPTSASPGPGSSPARRSSSASPSAGSSTSASSSSWSCSFSRRGSWAR